MKKRIVSMMLAAMVALSVVGCGSKTLSNDYVTVKQYKGLEVAQVEKVEVTDEQVEQSVQANLNAAVACCRRGPVYLNKELQRRQKKSRSKIVRRKKAIG